MSWQRALVRSFAVAAVATAIMVPLRQWLFVDLLDVQAPFLPFAWSVMAAAWLGGHLAGGLALALGVAVGFYISAQPDVTPFIRAGLPVRLAAFLVTGGILDFLFASLHSARRKAAERQRELECEVAERCRAETAEKEQRLRLAEEIRRREEMELVLREREERIRMAVESANMGTFDFNPLTGERRWSERAKLMFGLPPDADVTNVSFLDRVHPDDRQRASQAVQAAFDPRGNGDYEIDCRLVWPDGSIHWFIAKGKALFEGQGSERRATRFIGTVLEITERKQAELAVRQAEEKFRAVATHAPVGIFQTDIQGRRVFVNQRWCEIVGAEPSEALGESWQAFLHPEDRQKYLDEWQNAVRHGRGLLKDVRFVNPDTGIRWVTGSVTALQDSSGGVIGYIGTTIDVTDRKLAAEALEAEQELMRHTIQLQDHERKLIAYEIHDGLVQYATGALMQLEGLRGRTDCESLVQQIDDIAEVLQRAVAEGRRIIDGIHTPVLDDWGVVAAVRQLIDEEERAHVRVEFDGDPALGRMDRGIEEALYRITQEAMTNVRKHSQAENVRVELCRRGDRVHLCVRDWGVGFTPANGARQVHGLMGMTERARIAGGQCKIHSAPGQGTQIVVDLPYRPRG